MNLILLILIEFSMENSNRCCYSNGLEIYRHLANEDIIKEDFNSIIQILRSPLVSFDHAVSMSNNNQCSICLNLGLKSLKLLGMSRCTLKSLTCTIYDKFRQIFSPCVNIILFWHVDGFKTNRALTISAKWFKLLSNGSIIMFLYTQTRHCHPFWTQRILKLFIYFIWTIIEQSQASPLMQNKFYYSTEV